MRARRGSESAADQAACVSRISRDRRRTLREPHDVLVTAGAETAEDRPAGDRWPRHPQPRPLHLADAGQRAASDPRILRESQSHHQLLAGA